MVWGILVCLAVVAVVSLLVQRPHEEKVKAIDYSAPLAAARKAAPYAVLAPDPMPSGWQATSARVETEPGKPFGWHLGVITTDKRYVGLEQSNAAAAAFVKDKLGPVGDDGTSAVSGATWQRKTLQGKDERALVRTVSGATVILTSSAGYDVLESYAAVLR